MTVWRLRSGADKRFRSGHPWVYSNELMESPKGLEPGAPVELRDAGGRFLARGYGNPHSLIAFRALSRDESLAEPMSAPGVAARLLEAQRVRRALGLADFSHRLCFGEADQLPGLVIDRYRLHENDGDAQVYVVQAHTAGADRIASGILGILKEVTDDARKAGGPDWNRTAVVLRNDLGVRKLEGIEEQEPRVLKDLPGYDLSRSMIRVRSASDPGNAIVFQADLAKGQKTGFFLDQAANIELAVAKLRPWARERGKVRILDLCCYVGQWSAQLAAAFRKEGVSVEVTAVDASAPALEMAKRNIESQQARCETLKTDVLKGLESIPGGSFDLIISDPPALIKGRKDIPAGTHAYLTLNTQVFRILAGNGAAICCSCSALLEEDEFLRALSKASYRNTRSIRWIARGAPAVDHPMRIEFPEGRYLKCWIGLE